jgi:hypothetical protein
MPLFARMVIGLLLAMTGQIVEMGTMLVKGVDFSLVLVTGIAVFVVILNVTVFLGGRG